MRFAIEATAVCRPVRTGVARYTLRLVEAMAALLPTERPDDRMELVYRLSRWSRRRHVLRPPGVRVRWVQEPFLPLRPGVDLVHGTDARVPAWRNTVRFATVHDVFSLLFERFADAAFRDKKLAVYRRLARLCHGLVVDSAATRDDFLKHVDFPAERVSVVPLGVDPAFRPREAEETAPVLDHHGLRHGGYLLYVGEISARKNIPGLLAGYAAGRARRDLPLVLAGAMSYGADAAKHEASRLDLGDQVRFLGYVPDGDLPALYSGAAAFVFPTWYEGFGLPVLEAMASGVPVVGGERGSVPEVAGGHALLVDPGDPGAIAEAIDRVLDLPPDRRDAARVHAAHYTWEACARGVLAAYDRALGT